MADDCGLSVMVTVRDISVLQELSCLVISSFRSTTVPLVMLPYFSCTLVKNASTLTRRPIRRGWWDVLNCFYTYAVIYSVNLHTCTRTCVFNVPLLRDQPSIRDASLRVCCYLICLIYSLLEADNTGNCTGALQLLSSSYAQLLGIILWTDCFTISQSMYAFGLVLSGQCRDGAGPDKNR